MTQNKIKPIKTVIIEEKVTFKNHVINLLVYHHILGSMSMEITLLQSPRSTIIF